MKRIVCSSLALLLFSLARAANPPSVKEGLWEVRGQITENPGSKRADFAYRICRDHAYDKAMDDRVRNVQGCSTSFDSLGHGHFASASRCTADKVVIDSKGTTTYESDTVIHSESRATYTPAFRGRTDETIVEEQRYLGPCPVGVQPGDRIMPDGSLQRYVR